MFPNPLVNIRLLRLRESGESTTTGSQPWFTFPFTATVSIMSFQLSPVSLIVIALLILLFLFIVNMLSYTVWILIKCRNRQVLSSFFCDLVGSVRLIENILISSTKHRDFVSCQFCNQTKIRVLAAGIVFNAISVTFLQIGVKQELSISVLD